MNPCGLQLGAAASVPRQNVDVFAYVVLHTQRANVLSSAAPPNRTFAALRETVQNSA